MATKEELSREVTLTFPRGPRIAVITIDRQKKLNAVTQGHYFRIAELLDQVAKKDEVVVTVITGKGRFFSALVTHHHVRAGRCGSMC